MSNSLKFRARFPLKQLDALARMESYNKHYYRPANYLHKWWARRLGSVFRTLVLMAFLDEDEDVWERYYSGAQFPGKIVLDPFMGGGTTIVEALRLGCKVVGSDLNPVAWWTVKQAVTSVELEALDQAFARVESQVRPEIERRYQTTCPTCGRISPIVFVLWVKIALCVQCGEGIALHTDQVIARDKHGAVVHCPKCAHVFRVVSVGRKASCPSCQHAFAPTDRKMSGSRFACLACGRRQTIIEAARAHGRPFDHQIYAINYLCPEHGQGFKAPDREDFVRYTQAQTEFERSRDLLLYPRQPIPSGLKTDDLLKHGYRHWHELFNSRQLLCLDALLRAILAEPDMTLRELLLTLFSSSLEFNNMLCSYKGDLPSKPGAVRHIFSHHAFVLTHEPLENNPWGIAGSSGGFASLYASRLRASREFAAAPVERVIRGGKTIGKVVIPGERIASRFAGNYGELSASLNTNVLLLCQDSATLPLPDASVDAVITDPPYFDNVQYSELSDFFYIWLRLGLAERYPQIFGPDQTPKSVEIVKNPHRHNDSRFYLEGMTHVFSECQRVLKDDGVLVFTFHHLEDEAWAAVLQAVLDSDFRVSATYPIHAEMPISVHIHGQEAIAYDSIIVCRKGESVGTVTWQEVEEQIRVRATEVLAQLPATGNGLSRADASVIALGACLECYSAYYPNVTLNGSQVAVSEAIALTSNIVTSLTHSGTFQHQLLEERETTYVDRKKKGRVPRR
jgi:putative DNA methylase